MKLVQNDHHSREAINQALLCISEDQSALFLSFCFSTSVAYVDYILNANHIENKCSLSDSYLFWSLSMFSRA